MELAAITSNKTVCFFCNIIKQPEFIGENIYHQEKTEIERSRLSQTYNLADDPAEIKKIYIFDPIS